MELTVVLLVKMYYNFWNQNSRYRVSHSLQPVSVLSYMNLDYTNSSYLGSILILSSYLHIGLPSGLFPLYISYSHRVHIFFSTVSDTYPVNLILLGMIMLLMSGEECPVLSSLLCRFLKPPAVSFLFSARGCQASSVNFVLLSS